MHYAQYTVFSGKQQLAVGFRNGGTLCVQSYQIEKRKQRKGM
jgi:hypothetical protein